MGRKYLEDIGIENKDTPQGWNENDKRQEEWKCSREIYGFDERETWSLDYSFKLWLYERLSMYNEVNCINTSYHKFVYKDQTLTLQDCINRMLEGLKYDLTSDELNSKKQYQEQIDDVIPILNLCLPCLWW